MFGVPEKPVHDLAPILARLKWHSRSRSLEVLRERLIQEGYPPDDVDRGIAISGKELPSPDDPILLKVLLVLAVNLVVFLIGNGLHLGFFSLANLMLATTGVEFFLGLAMKSSLETRAWGRALARGGGILFIPLSVSYALLFLVAGLCAGTLH